MRNCRHPEPVLFGEVGPQLVVPASFIGEGRAADQDTACQVTIYQCPACSAALVVTTLCLPDGRQLFSPPTVLDGAR